MMPACGTPAARAQKRGVDAAIALKMIEFCRLHVT
jgi:hypothetical protein